MVAGSCCLGRSGKSGVRVGCGSDSFAEIKERDGWCMGDWICWCLVWQW